MKKALFIFVYFAAAANVFAISMCDVVNGNVQLGENQTEITTNIPAGNGFAILGPRVLEGGRGNFVVPSLFAVQNSLQFWNRTLGSQKDAMMQVRRVLRAELLALDKACGGDPAKIKAVRDVMTQEIIHFIVDQLEMRRTEFLVQNPDPTSPEGVSLPDGQRLLLKDQRVAKLNREWISEYRMSFPFEENVGR